MVTASAVSHIMVYLELQEDASLDQKMIVTNYEKFFTKSMKFSKIDIFFKMAQISIFGQFLTILKKTYKKLLTTGSISIRVGNTDQV